MGIFNGLFRSRGAGVRWTHLAEGEAVLSDKGKVDPEKLHALMFDQFQHGYYATGAKFPKQISFGEHVFINHSFTAMSIGGITIEDNVQIGPHVTVVSLGVMFDGSPAVRMWKTDR